ncbi:hypothetical protein FEZ21_02625 [Pseudomonas sp. 9.1(2019)]|nr:hypothetical protein [Pseudomonas sp. 9.1(2019)]
MARSLWAGARWCKYKLTAVIAGRAAPEREVFINIDLYRYLCLILFSGQQHSRGMALSAAHKLGGNGYVLGGIGLQSATRGGPKPRMNRLSRFLKIIK